MNRSPSPVGTATTSDLSTRAWRWSARSAAAIVVVRADGLGGRQVATAGEHRQPLEHALLVVEEELVAPVDDRAQRLLARERGARPAGEQAEPIVQAGGDLRDRERAGAGRRELDGERQPVEAARRCRRSPRGGRRRARAARRRPAARATKRRTASSASSGGTGQMVSPPTRSPSRLVARMRRPGQRRKRSSATSAAVVITCSQLSSTMQHLPVADQLGQPARVREVERGRDRGADAGRIADRRQLDQATAERQTRPTRRAPPPARAASCRPLPARRGSRSDARRAVA